jgi:hypothetical protein
MVHTEGVGVDLHSDNIDAIKKSRGTLTDARNVVGLEINAEKTKYMLLSRHQNSGQYHDIKIGNRSFENMARLKYLGTTVTNQNLIQDEFTRRLNSGNACYHSVQKLLSYRLVSKDIKIRIYKIIMLPMALYRCETCSLILTVEHRLRVFKNRVLRRIFGPKRDEVTGGWRKLHYEELHNLYSSPSIITMIKPWSTNEAKRNAHRILGESRKQRDH